MVDQGEDGGSEREYLAGDGVRGSVISPVGVRTGDDKRLNAARCQPCRCDMRVAGAGAGSGRKETYHWKIRNLWRDSRNLRREI